LSPPPTFLFEKRKGRKKKPEQIRDGSQRGVGERTVSEVSVKRVQALPGMSFVVSGRKCQRQFRKGVEETKLVA